MIPNRIRVDLNRFEHIEAELDRIGKEMPPERDWYECPLPRLLGPALLCQFSLLSVHEQNGYRIWTLLHCPTQGYLLLGDDLQTFNWSPRGQVYYPIALASALDSVFQGTELVGAFPGVPYDQEFKRKLRDEVEARGEKIIFVVPGQGVQDVDDGGDACPP